jgi:hypothetical protein
LPYVDYFFFADIFAIFAFAAIRHFSCDADIFTASPLFRAIVFFCHYSYFDIDYFRRHADISLLPCRHAAMFRFSIADAFDADFHAIIAGFLRRFAIYFRLLRHAMIFLLILLFRCFRCHC